jgi:acetate kinase
VVHGGLKYDAPVRVTEAVLEDLARLAPLAPGEHDASSRAEVVAGSRRTGAVLDVERNKRGEGLISNEDSSVAVWVIPTDEERLIARQTAEILH